MFTVRGCSIKTIESLGSEEWPNMTAVIPKIDLHGNAERALVGYWGVGFAVCSCQFLLNADESQRLQRDYRQQVTEAGIRQELQAGNAP